GGGRGQPNVGAALGIDSLADEDGLRVLDGVIALDRGATVLPCPQLGESLDVQSLLVVRGDEPGREPEERAPRAEDPHSDGDGSSARWLVELFSDALAIPEEALDPDADFGDLGVESVMLGELVQLIEARLGASIAPSTLLEHPTLRQLSAHLAESEH